MDGIMIFAIILAIVGFIAFRGIKRASSDRNNKKLFLDNASQIKKGQSLDEVVSLLGRPTSYTEMDDKYVLKWEQTEETGLNSITRAITVVVNKNESVVDVYRDNMN